MSPGDIVEGFYLLKSAAMASLDPDETVLRILLSDSTGEMDAVYREFAGELDLASDIGRIVKIRGEVQQASGTPLIDIRRIRLASDMDGYDLNDIVPVAPIDSLKELEFIQNLVSTIEDDDYRRICENMLDRHVARFGAIPASKTTHHCFISGLLMHTGNMLRIADYLATEIYPYVVDRSLLLAGTLLHDFAKEKEYAFSDLGLITERSPEGLLLGHSAMGAEEVGRLGTALGIPEPKTMLLQHMILSHQEQGKNGAAVEPCIAESELLRIIDAMDSRMEIYSVSFENTEKGSFSKSIPALGGKKIFNH